MNERDRLEQKIRDLEAKLSSTSSSIGDWKILKASEYRLMGMEVPYDMDSIMQQRQAVRDEINRIQKKLEAMPVEDEPETDDGGMVDWMLPATEPT